MIPSRWLVTCTQDTKQPGMGFDLTRPTYAFSEREAIRNVYLQLFNQGHTDYVATQAMNLGV